jgi:chromosomal replication initiation ATPase DnaA
MGRVAARYYPEPQAIAEIVCEIARLPVEELMGDRRTQNRVRARFVVWTLIYDLICPKYEYVAAYSGKDHTSCHHGIKTLRARLATDVRLRNLYDAALLTIRRDLGEAPPRYQWSET